MKMDNVVMIRDTTLLEQDEGHGEGEGEGRVVSEDKNKRSCMHTSQAKLTKIYIM